MCITDICMTEINFKAMFFDILKKIKIKFASDSQWNLTQLRTYNGEMHKLIEYQLLAIFKKKYEIFLIDLIWNLCFLRSQSRNN